MSRPQSPLRLHLALTVAASLFSANFILSKLAMHAFSPFVFVYLRIVGAALVLNLFLRERETAPLTRDDWKRLITYSFLGVIINQTFFLGGLSLTSAHVAAILTTTIPIFALGIAIGVRREHLTTARVAGIAVAAIGAVLIIGFEGFDGSPRAVIGDLLIFCNCFSYALYLVFSKPMMARMSARRVLSVIFGFSAVALLPVAIWPLLREPWATIGSGAWLALGVVILGPTVGAYLINGWALRYADSSLVAAYSYLQPVMTVILAWFFLGEVLRPAALGAGAMIVAGVFVASRK